MVSTEFQNSAECARLCLYLYGGGVGASLSVLLLLLLLLLLVVKQWAVGCGGWGAEARPSTEQGAPCPRPQGACCPQQESPVPCCAGNVGGEAEEAAVAEAAGLIQESCRGLVAHLKALRQSTPPGASLREALAAWLQQTEAMDWLVPPMLQRK